MTETMANQGDKRWGGYLPWFIRYRDYSGPGIPGSDQDKDSILQKNG
jgi:hypothetical protein